MGGVMKGIRLAVGLGQFQGVNGAINQMSAMLGSAIAEKPI
jgi:hypothetical protein